LEVIVGGVGKIECPIKYQLTRASFIPVRRTAYLFRKFAFISAPDFTKNVKYKG